MRKHLSFSLPVAAAILVAVAGHAITHAGTIDKQVPPGGTAVITRVSGSSSIIL